MKVLLSWLRELVPVPDAAEDLARTMSVRGFAVEGFEPFGDGDAVLDFEVTANRPDCMSIAGMAREVATACELPLEPAGHPAAGGVPRTKRAARAGIQIAIENPDLCPRYVGAVADVTVGPSPPWMQARLQASGVRPINNVVDVTNYVLLELGHPMHAFDLARIAGPRIRVRTAQPGETLRTLDGHVRTLSPEMLVIADANRAAAVAGVMGGADAEVTGTTTAVVLESAYFRPLSVRRTSRKLGLKTEASIRFERGADPAMPALAMERALSLLETIGAGNSRGAAVDEYPARIDPILLRLRRARVGGLLGATVSDADVRRILEALGFTLAEAPGGWDVTVPTRRVDVLREVDLIEEVARHYGLDRLPVTFPAVTVAPPPPDPRIALARRLRCALTGAGFSEAVTFGFIARTAAERFAADDDVVPIANPLSESFAVLRPSVLPGLVDAVAHNRRREQRDVRLFEIGARFTRSGGERRSVACAWTGAAPPEHWSGTGRAVDFFDMKAVAERIGELVGTPIETVPADVPWLAPGRRAAVVSEGARVGVFGQLAHTVAAGHGLPEADAVYVAEIDLDALEHGASERAVRVEPLPRFPSVIRDISILIDDTLPASEIRRTIGGVAPGNLARVGEFDRYQGQGVPPGKVSLSLRLTFRSSDRTLTDSEVQTALEDVISALRDRHGAIQR